jgi:hypothetical protein
MFYLLIFIILLLFASLDINKKLNEYSKNISLLFLFLIFWLIAGLRYETGVDWPGYTQFYNQIENISNIFGGSIDVLNNSEFEIGYTLLNSILKLFTNNVQLLFLFIALVTNLMLFSSLKIYSNHIFISLIIYFCTMYFVTDMDIIRQCISINIFFISLKYIIHKNIYKYFLLIFIASLFHQTALLLLPLYFFLNKRFKNSILLIFVSIGVIFALFQISWLRFVINHAIDLGAFTLKLSSYMMKGHSRIFGIGFLGNLIILVFCLIKRNSMKSNKMFNLFLNMYVFSLIFYYFTWEISIISSRFRLYFLIGNIVLLTYFIDMYKNRLIKSLVFVFIVSYCLFYGRIYLFEYTEAISYNPYQNYVIYKMFDIKSTGTERLQLFMNFIEEKSKNDY